MKNIAILLFTLFFHSAYGQQTIDKLNANQLKLPKESVNKALILDGSGQVKSSATISDTELGYLEGLNDTLVNLLSGKANDGDVVKLTGDQSIAGVKTFTGKLVASSTVNGSIPCPVMSQTQRDAITSPVIGDCVFNSTTIMANIYDGSVWKPIGGGLSLWEPYKAYTANDVVVQLPQYKTYIATMSHTSGGSFDSDLVAGNWLEVSGGGVTPWTTGKFYNVNDLMIYDNKIYIATISHTSSGMIPTFVNWTQVGGAGGISLWAPANFYNLNAIVIESDKIYRCIIAHTSGTFSTDLASGKWAEVSGSPVTPYSLSDGGTNKALTAVNGGIVWVDADSFEVLGAGTSGQILQSNGASSPSWVNKSISAKSEVGSSVTLEEIQVPNNQLTVTNTNKHKIETGNKNILVNPSFEHSTFSTGWTNSAGTFAEDLVVEVDGLKAAKVTLSSQALDLRQDSTLYQAQFADGIQGLAMVRVKTSVAGLRVCSRQAGAVNPALCVSVQPTGKWGLYKVPFILGGTSNGISINSNSVAVTGDVYVDDAFVGAVDLKQDTDAVGPWIDYGQMTITATTTNPTKATTRQQDNVRCRVVGQDYECEYTYRADSATGAAAGSGDYIFALPSGIEFDSLIPNFTTITSVWISAQANASQLNTTGQININSASGDGSLTAYAYSSTSFRLAASENYVNIVNMGSTWYQLTNQPLAFRFFVKFRGKGLSANSSIYTSTNADTDWADCGITSSTSGWQGFGTPTAIELQCKRQGGDLLMKGKFTSGTSTAVEARVPLPVWNGTQLVSAGTSIIPSLQPSMASFVPFTTATGFGNNSFTLIEPNVSYVAFQSPTTIAISKVSGSTIASSGSVVSVISRIPIAGWTQSNIIIGQFNGLETCTDTYQCTDTFSAKVSATGVVSDENLDWINGNASLATSTYTITFKSSLFSVAPNCVVTNDQSSTAAQVQVISSSSSTLVFILSNSTGTATAGGTIIHCQKQGADYIGKTAKAVASDQNLRTPGITNAVVYSAFVSGAGVVSNEIGDLFNGNCTLSGANNNRKTCTFAPAFVGAPRCQVTPYGCTTEGSACGRDAVIANLTSTTLLTAGYNNADTAYTANDLEITCHGVIP